MVDLVTETFTTPGTSTRVALTAGTAVVECWGSGSGGVEGDPSSSGGGGGAYSKLTYSVSSGQSFDAIVPAGGGANASGADAIFKITSSTELCKAKGGNGYLGGAAGSGIGDVKYSGGSSASGGATGGGSSAGTAANGNNASATSGGSAPTGGGAGGTGDDTGGAYGENGFAPGGGGGGASYGFTAGSGANGKVIVTWTASGGGFKSAWARGSNIMIDGASN